MSLAELFIVGGVAVTLAGAFGGGISSDPDWVGWKVSFGGGAVVAVAGFFLVFFNGRLV